ncbi:ER membrane protein complex subunit 8-like [Ruditapes philippinarum]|uniref:ER membrane protein complex subunit 8-like n=1 Tax=Ruditapes philippinarum TaxID=129788 RepID=UPI00295A62F8|nr:ER membrane protein complex subunit 8-like [Ruditapes philippinarum]
MAEISVSMKAYAKLLLHAAKYPHCAVNGLLLAEDTKTSKEKKSIRFVDCIPLFHLSLSLAPMLEAALLQIDSYCKSKGYVIGGYYQANEHLSDNSVNNVARHIGKKIHEYYPDACIFMIDNNRVSPESPSEVYRVHTMKETGWKEADKRQTVDEDTLQTASVLLEQEQYRHLVDFDNHLDDVANDWRNTKLNDIIERCL